MKEIIEKFIELAKDYVVFGIEIGLPDTHNHIRGGHQSNPEFHQKGDLINIYLSNHGESWAVTFTNIEIVGYCNKISIPFGSTQESLEKTYNDVHAYLFEYLLPNVAKCKLATMKERHAEIKKLERQLRTLKGLC